VTSRYQVVDHGSAHATCSYKTDLQCRARAESTNQEGVPRQLDRPVMLSHRPVIDRSQHLAVLDGSVEIRVHALRNTPAVGTTLPAPGVR
jgi:hypothetical protein